MNRLMSKFLLVATLFVFKYSDAQIAKGQQLLYDERYESAIQVFSSSTDEESMFYKGYAEMKLDEKEEAKATFEKIASSPFGKIGMGWLALNEGNAVKAADLFAAAEKETKGKNPRIFISISKAYINAKIDDKSKGIEWAKKAVDNQKSNAEFRIVYGDAYLATQDGGNAITQYEYAMQYDPNSALPIAKVGKVYFQGRQFEESKNNLEKALAKDPNNLLALNYLAQIQYKMGKYEDAKATQQKLLVLGDKSIEDRAYMANILFKGKQYKECVEYTNEIIKTNNKYNYLNRLIGYAEFETGNAKACVDYMQKFLETQPADKIIAEDYEYLSKAMIAAGSDTNSALQTLEKAYTLDTNNFDVLKSIASTYFSMKRYNIAKRYYLIKIAKTVPSENDYFQLARTFDYQKIYDSADIYYSKVIELNPSQCVAYYAKAQLKKFSDPNQETASAKPDYLKFIELCGSKVDKYKKNIITAKLYLAKIALRDGDVDGGQATLEEVLLLDPANAEATELKNSFKK